MRQRAIKAAVGACAMALMMLPGTASGDDRWSVRGAGWGHGIGMSQFGAYGLAKHGSGYRQILAHYYTGTRVVRGGVRVARVLLQANRSSVSFSGATRAGGRKLKEGSLYKATREGSRVVLRSSSGRRLKTYSGVIPITGGALVRLLGKAGNGVRDGLYRGSLEIRTAAGAGLNAINTLGMEKYLEGVVPAESPPIWPPAALQAQAVAARSYASTTSVNGKGFDQYPDTRSQVYRGYAAETATTNNAVAATAGEVVTYNGQPVVTYFFSTSGGHTENVENVFTASPPKPWLRGVEDPYDEASPYHRWGPYSWSTGTIDAKLGSYVKGRFRDIDVVKRGVSPRVVRAIVRGSRGDTAVNGPQLRARLGLRDTWFFIRRVSTNMAWAQARTSSGSRRVTAIHGTVEPIRARFVQLQRRLGERWVTLENVPLDLEGRTGSYRFHVSERGRYRVLAGWAPGPAIDVKGQPRRPRP
jgi:stage II sporulation protein D